MVASAVTPRSEIAKAYTWNDENVFPTMADWESACDSVPQEVSALKAFQGRLGESADTLAAFYALAEPLQIKVYKIQVYAGMFASVDSLNQTYTMMAGRAQGLIGMALGALGFVEPELLAIGREKLAEWGKSNAKIAEYQHAYDDLFRRQAHVRSSEVEELLGMLSDVRRQPYGTYGMLTDTDLQYRPATDSAGNTHAVTQGMLQAHLNNTDRELRRTAYESFTDGHLSVKNTLASNLVGAVKLDVFYARARRFDTALEASLFENNIPKEAFFNLIDTFKKNIPTWHRYWDVRRKMLGVETLQPYDVWAPLTAQNPVVSYEQAVEWISAGMSPLGEHYVETLRRGCLQDRWVDVYPNAGKRQGAFSSGSYGTFPFIMMSYNDNLLSMSTLAHELGHSMHSYLTNHTQPLAYADYSLFVAEVASNFNQAMVRDYLRKAKADDRNFQIALIEEAMSNFHRYFFIMPTLARFELEVHTRIEQGKGVNANILNGLMADLFAEGYGDSMGFDRERVGITWGTFLHMYLNYYVYQYATGISAAHALAARVLSGEEGAAQRYVEFLSMGSSHYPIDALKHAGVDMMTPQAVETTFGVLSSMVDQLEALA